MSGQGTIQGHVGGVQTYENNGEEGLCVGNGISYSILDRGQGESHTKVNITGIPSVAHRIMKRVFNGSLRYVRGGIYVHDTMYLCAPNVNRICRCGCAQN